MTENTLDILNFIVSSPGTIWNIALMGAVCVIGVVDYLRCFFEKKKNSIRWVVLFMSLLVAVIFSPIVPNVITTVVIIGLLILALATIGKKHIMDGIGGLIEKIIGSSTNGGSGA